MVAPLFPQRARGSGWIGKVTLALGAVFLVAASYTALETAISGNARNAYSGGDAPLTLDAIERLTPGERSDAENVARKAFAHDPLDATAVLDLSGFALAQGNTDASERLRLTAGDMTPRATRIQAEALVILLKRRDFERVMSRVDGLIRARPAEAVNFFGLVSEISGDPDALMAVARMIGTDPPWRRQFFLSLLQKGNADTAARIMDGLRAVGVPPSDDELAAVIDAYLRGKEIDKAYALWLSNLSEAELQDVKLVYDGGFAHPVRNLQFDWTVKPADAMTTRLFPRNTASMDQTLQFDFVDFPGTISNLSQILRLRPGRHRLSGEVRSESFESATGLVFRVYCLDSGQRKVLDATAPLPQSSQWISFDKRFEIPKEGCPDQVLRLESQHPLDNSQLTRGMVAIDLIAIDKVPDLAP